MKADLFGQFPYRRSFVFLLLLTLIGIRSAGVVRASVFALAGSDEIRWEFGTEETTPLRATPGVHRDVPGPRPPDYPDFPVDNTAVRLDGQGAHLWIDDPGVQSHFDFTNGDSITLEAWVQVDEIRGGENVYVIGKGRTGNAGFPSDNQNWALRVRENNGLAAISFLFATPKNRDVKIPTAADAHWHRWTSSGGFRPGNSWHHIAVTYRFGEPESIAGWIDGKRQTGKWDMGGPTADPPVVDDDAVWIGSAMKGSASSSFRGSLDGVAIHRNILDDRILGSRFHFTGKDTVIQPAPEVMPEPDGLAPGRILLTLREGMPSHTRWLNTDESLPPESLRWDSDVFLLDRLPVAYDAWGIREEWKAPVLLQLAADVPLPTGKHRFLMRVRGLSRLWVNGEIVARADPLTGSPSGEEPVTPLAGPPVPGSRIAEHRQQERFSEVTIDGNSPARIILETIVGGKSLRPDPGEICVAIMRDDDSEIFLLTPAPFGESPVPLTDKAVVPALKRLEEQLSAFDDSRRRMAASTQDAYWKMRHSFARTYAADLRINSHPILKQALAEGTNPIDAFLEAKRLSVLEQAAKPVTAEESSFHGTVLPILRDACMRCHGEKANGGLKLDSLQAAVKGGDSETPAIVPGHPSQSELIRRIRSGDPDERMPPGIDPLPDEHIALLEDWIRSGASWPLPPLSDDAVTRPVPLTDAQFIRRVWLDTVGVLPGESDVRAFLNDAAADKRTAMIDRLLNDDRAADHWMSYWQDVLAENPTLINYSLNSTGPFRWFLYDALRDHKSFDRIVTELVLLRGSAYAGGSAGFGIAADNDAPFAAKGQIIGTAFLGIEMQCARCHDSPYHSTKQRDLYALAAMLEQKPVRVPATSRVPSAFFESKVRESLIRVSMQPDEVVEPHFPFPELCDSPDDDTLRMFMQNPDSAREKLAVFLTSPFNHRFAEVAVNRIWRHFLGAGFVEPPHDWEGQVVSHPELLQWLSAEFLSHNYDIRHVSRLIMTSQVYQRQATGNNRRAVAQMRLFVAPDQRRMTAEQLLDSLHAAAGKIMDAEELTFDPDGRRPASNRLTLGIPGKAWMMASLANERDRPTLGLPRARLLTDVMEAFGWTGSRQNPRTDREAEPNVLQAGVLSNSVAAQHLTRITADSDLSRVVFESSSPDELVDRIFLRYLSRYPTDAEKAPLTDALTDRFSHRRLSDDQVRIPEEWPRLPKVTWSNHLRSEANLIALELEQRAQQGPHPDPRIDPEWREICEDVIWSVINLREFVWLP